MGQVGWPVRRREEKNIQNHISQAICYVLKRKKKCSLEIVHETQFCHFYVCAGLSREWEILMDFFFRESEEIIMNFILIIFPSWDIFFCFVIKTFSLLLFWSVADDDVGLSWMTWNIFFHISYSFFEQKRGFQSTNRNHHRILAAVCYAFGEKSINNFHNRTAIFGWNISVKFHVSNSFLVVWFPTRALSHLPIIQKLFTQRNNSKARISIDDCFTSSDWKDISRVEFLSKARTLLLFALKFIENQLARNFFFLSLFRLIKSSMLEFVRWWKDSRHSTHGMEAGSGRRRRLFLFLYSRERDSMNMCSSEAWSTWEMESNLMKSIKLPENQFNFQCALPEKRRKKWGMFWCFPPQWTSIDSRSFPKDSPSESFDEFFRINF